MKSTVVIKDLTPSVEDAREATLTADQMKRLTGGRAVRVGVDGTSTGTVDDWDIDIGIFEGRIGGTYL
ncbi:MAG: hypothetical protein EPN73_14940 [Paraburkholderia sp.]|uniref:hypothetical protein n=1 Tax=Paraburkholderia sp. TaxID=1926495 RepID=UPI0011F7FED2|nr:hypothetical protein [Paraburkholderia sp.]TAL95056.1 MAG: hypothetical protein EPN73_14940 [Paraburkholderia sp.]